MIIYDKEKKTESTWHCSFCSNSGMFLPCGQKLGRSQLLNTSSDTSTCAWKTKCKGSVASCLVGHNLFSQYNCPLFWDYNFPNMGGRKLFRHEVIVAIDNSFVFICLVLNPYLVKIEIAFLCWCIRVLQRNKTKGICTWEEKLILGKYSHSWGGWQVQILPAD